MTQAQAAVHTPQQLSEINGQLDGKSPEEIIRWAAKTFGTEIKLASSFGAG